MNPQTADTHNWKRFPTGPPEPIADPDPDPSGFIIPRPTLAPATLEASRGIQWRLAPRSQAASCFTSDVERLALASEKRGRARAIADAEAFRAALAAIVASALEAWSQAFPRPVSHALSAPAFTSLPIGARTACAAFQALVAANLLHLAPGVRAQRSSGRWAGMVSRWWPTPELIRLAVNHGLTPAAFISGDAFHAAEPVNTPATATRSDIECKPVRWRDGDSRTWSEVPFAPLSAAALEAARASVRELQSRVAQSSITGCLPPTFHRILYGCEAGHGRYYVQAPGGVSYQQMPKAQRLARLAINGEAVAEVDVRASQLSILHGLLGIPLPEGDPYAIPGIPRNAVKAFITETLGVGRAKQRWSEAAAQRALAEGWPPLRVVSAAVCLRYPFLRSPVQAVPSGFLPQVPTEVALCHFLCGVEAEAMTTAMRLLWHDHRALALPIHDSLIVPSSAVDAAKDAIDIAFLTFANVSPTLTADLPPAFAAAA